MGSESPFEPAGSNSTFEWSSNRLAVTYQEARTVLNAQQTRKQNTDDKALRTVRLTTIIVGVLISLIDALDLTVSATIATTGGVFLVVAFAAGIATYNATNLYLGPNQEYIEALVADNFDDGETAWEGDLLRLMGE